MRSVSLMGSSGSIGTQALDVVRTEPDRLRVHALAAHRSADLLVAQAREFEPDVVVIGDPDVAETVRNGVPAGTGVLTGEEGMVEAARGGDVVLNAVVGFAGLPVTMAALESGKRLALANKESLIAGAPVVQKARRTPGAEIVPVDSEHCALHQCLAAVDGATARKLYDAFRAFDADADASVAVFTGTGGFFCAGADLKAVASGDPNKKREIGGHDSIAPMGPSRLRLSKPVIAAVEGFAVAGGMELALWADMRVVAEDATFGVFCRRFGVPLIDLGTIRLPRLIGHSQAIDLILTGRPVGGAEALRMGLANRLVAKGETRAQAIALAKEIARFPQTCLRADRLSALRQWDLSEEEAIANEMRGGLEVIASGETLSGATRFASGVGRHGAFGSEN